MSPALSKLHPFWWFLAPPCVVVDWENCDDLTGITADPYFNASIDTSIKKEGTGSLKVSNLTNEATVKTCVFDDLDTFQSTTMYFGFYFRMSQSNGTTFFRFSVRNTVNGHYIQLQANHNTGTGKPHLRLAVNGTGGAPMTAYTDIEYDTDYFIELAWISANSQKWYIDDAEQPSLTGYGVDLSANQEARLENGAGGNIGTVWIDPILIKTYQEHPPCIP